MSRRWSLFLVVLGADRYLVLVVRFAREQDKADANDHQNEHQHYREKIPWQVRRVGSAGITASNRQQYERTDHHSNKPGNQRDSVKQSFLRHFQMPAPIGSYHSGDQRNEREQSPSPHVAEQIPADELTFVAGRQLCIYQQSQSQR